LEQGRVGFAGQAEPGGVVAVDEHVEQVQQAGGGDDGPAVPAGRDDGGAAAALAQLVQQGDGGGEGGHAVLGDLADEQLVLGHAEPVHGRRARLVLRAALGQGDAAGGEEGAHAVQARASVDVAEVVVADVERRGAAAQETVEDVLPRGGVHAGGVGDDAVGV